MTKEKAIAAICIVGLTIVGAVWGIDWRKDVCGCPAAPAAVSVPVGP